MNNYTGMNRNANNGAKNNDSRQLTGFSAEIYEWLEAIAFALGIVVLLFTFVFRIVSVSGSSMESTLHDKDRVLVWSMFYSPDQNDIIIILPQSEVENDSTESIFLNKPLVKRIIAVENQWIEIRDGSVYVADSQEALASVESFDSASAVALDSETYGGSFLPDNTPMQVPENCAFALGDNRGDSTDSRDARVGFIDYDNILGEVIFRIYPFNDGFGTVD